MYEEIEPDVRRLSPPLPADFRCIMMPIDDPEAPEPDAMWANTGIGSMADDLTSTDLI
jgi:hypothetical protein